MRRIKSFKEHESIDESFKKLPIIAGLAAGLAMGNPDASAIERPKTEWKYLNKLSDTIELAKKNVIAKVNRNENIINKDVIVEKIKSVVIEEYKTKQTSTLMYYYFDPKKKIDVIMINLAKIDTNNFYQTLVHELTHLVDRHKVTAKQDVEVIKNLTRLEYAKYFDDWRKIEKKGKIYTVADLWSYAYSRDKSYFTSESEVEARLSSLYQFMVDKSILTAGERLQPHHVEKLKEWIKARFPEGGGVEMERSYHNFLRHDFIPILPLIDWSKEEGINMIVKHGNSNQDLA